MCFFSYYWACIHAYMHTCTHSIHSYYCHDSVLYVLFTVSFCTHIRCSCISDPVTPSSVPCSCLVHTPAQLFVTVDNFHQYLISSSESAFARLSSHQTTLVLVLLVLLKGLLSMCLVTSSRTSRWNFLLMDFATAGLVTSCTLFL